MTPDSPVDPGSTHRDTHGHNHGRSTVTPAEYARLTGLHVRTVRERIRRGELPAVMVKGRHGPEYRIPHPDTQSSQGAPTVTVTVDLPSINGDSYGPDPVDPPFPGPAQGPDLGELVALVDRLSRENLELAGRLGFYQSEIQHLQGENAHLKERIALLEAPKQATQEPVDQDRVDTTKDPPDPQNGSDSGAQQPPRRPWWAFWRLLEL